MKPCKKCGIQKALDLFSQDQRTRDSYRHTCMACEGRNTPPGTKNCPKCGRRKALNAFYPSRKSRVGVYSWCKPCMDNRKNLYRAKNREQQRIRDRAYYQHHKNRLRAKALAWQKTPKGRLYCAANQMLRYARQRNAPLIEKIDRLAIYIRDNGRCHICHHKVSLKTFTLDHLVPLARGGEHTARNQAVAHRTCNTKRGTGRLPAQLRLLG